jgi:hypothetical protein
MVNKKVAENMVETVTSENPDDAYTTIEMARKNPTVI